MPRISAAFSFERRRSQQDETEFIRSSLSRAPARNHHELRIPYGRHPGGLRPRIGRSLSQTVAVCTRPTRCPHPRLTTRTAVTEPNKLFGRGTAKPRAVFERALGDPTHHRESQSVNDSSLHDPDYHLDFLSSTDLYPHIFSLKQNSRNNVYS